MKKLYTLLLTLSLATVTAQAATKTVKHTIKSGETLYTIAKKNHTTIEEVRKANGLKKGDNLKIGRVLKVPKDTYFPNKKKKIAKKTNIKKSTKSAKYAIKNGDTLFTIARKHHTTIEEVKKANGLKKGETLKLGRVLKVPKNTYFPDKTKRIAKVTKKSKNKRIVQKTNKKSNIKRSSKSAKYTIKSGDTLSTIARKHNTTTAKMRKANGLKKGATLKLGRVLKVPKNGYVKSTKKKTFKIAKTKKSRQDKKLAKALMNIKSKKTAKKGQKFSMSDIFFSGKSKGKSSKMTKLAKKKLGKRYVWGAVGQKNTFDCSGFTSYVCKKNGITIPRTSRAQSTYGKYISRSDLRPGDLIFFDTSKRRKGYVNHVGIYLGNDRFIHASSAKKKVVITKLGKSFYSKRYKGARRVTS
ncbi:LysM peptidoglycan-binding domain-containing protein [Sulfurovum sp. CS9]|uniref:LysM peptidoglycan-binding domain-containing protein n=1 Tax=Sulfurovum sp. CS9 TaxID=3391146 RepID=UPI0039ED2D45